MSAFQQEEKRTDIENLLAASVHIGTRSSEAKMQPYIWRRRSDQTHIIHLGRVLEKVKLAARIIAACENPADIMVVSARPYGQRAVLKFAQYTGATAIAGRFTPGTFTNQITRQFREPLLVIVSDPRTDSQAVREASFVGVPCIAFCNSDSPLKFVDVVIPGNNGGKMSIALLYWLLAREVLRIRGVAPVDEPWDVSYDLFLYRDAEEIEEQAAERERRQIEDAAAGAVDLAQKTVYEGPGDDVVDVAAA